jgi:16S rRNA (cytidine1402-2'-O)-methyltransferase
MSTLQDVADCLGDRPIVICRELTKVFEEIIRGTAADVIRVFSGKTIKGEVTLIVGGGRQPEMVFSDEEIRNRIRTLEQGGTLSKRDSIDQVTRELGVSRKRVYGLTVKK